jgi:uncharacterized protein YjbI with pentapeptide repeats
VPADRVPRAARWAAAVVVDLGAAFACAVALWHYGLPLVHTAPGSGNRLGLTVAAGTVVAAAVGLPIAAWLSGARASGASRGSSVAGARERLDAAARQLGDRGSGAGQLAAVRSLAALGDEWPDGRQDCADVLCGYLRLPHDRDEAGPGEGVVRLSVLDALRARLDGSTKVAWENCRFDFSGAVFGQGSLDGARFVHCEVMFTGCRFEGEGLSVRGARFDRSVLDCSKITIGGDGTLDLTGTSFELSVTSFAGIRLDTGTLGLRRTRWRGGFHDFGGLRLDGGRVAFDGAVFTTSRRLTGDRQSALVDFADGEFTAGVLSFRQGRFEYERQAGSGRREDGPPEAPWPPLLSLGRARLSGASVDFGEADFVRGDVTMFREAAGGALSFRRARFRGARVSFGGDLTDCVLDFGRAQFYPGDDQFYPGDDRAGNPPFGQRWMEPLAEASKDGTVADVHFITLRYPSPAVDFTDVSLERTRVEFEHIEAAGGIIDFKGAHFDEAELCFAHADFDGTVLVLWNSRTTSGLLRLSPSTRPVILTDAYHTTHNRLRVVWVDGSREGHDGDPVEAADMRDITPWLLGISSMD